MKRGTPPGTSARLSKAQASMSRSSPSSGLIEREDIMNTDTTTTIFRDPVCGMTVLPDKAADSYEFKDEQYYFCSKSCLGKFTADPEAFLHKEPAGMVDEEAGDSYWPLIVVVLLITISTAALAL